MSEQLDLIDWTPPSNRFDGSTYNHTADSERLTGQIKLVHDAMIDGKWRTLAEIEAITHAPQASISARLRDLRKPRFQCHIVERRARGERERGLFEYRLVKP